jgi:hypothetical protein
LQLSQLFFHFILATVLGIGDTLIMVETTAATEERGMKLSNAQEKERLARRSADERGDNVDERGRPLRWCSDCMEYVSHGPHEDEPIECDLCGLSEWTESECGSVLASDVPSYLWPYKLTDGAERTKRWNVCPDCSEPCDDCGADTFGYDHGNGLCEECDEVRYG